MSQSLRALTGAPGAPQGVAEAQEEAEPRPSTGGDKRVTTRPSAPSAPTARLGMSGWALAVGAIATLLTWFFSAASLLFPRAFMESSISFIPVPTIFRYETPSLVLSVLVPVFFGLWAGSTKRPSLPWFSSPLRWLRRGGRSVLEIAMFAAGMPAWVGFFIVIASISDANASVVFTALAFVLAPQAFMSGAFLGNALRRVGLLGTPKEPLQGEEEGKHEEEVWTPRKEAQWGLVGSIIVALISAAASVIAAFLGGT
jgi:hypothetical protein